MRMGEIGVLPPDFARRLAPIASLRNVLVHGYVSIDWDEVYESLDQLDDLVRFADLVRQWLRQHGGFR